MNSFIRIKLLLSILCLCSAAWASTTTLTGSINDAQGNGLNGTLVMQLPTMAQDITTNTQVTVSPVYFRVVNGAITGGAPLYDVANLRPTGLYYITAVYDSAGRNVFNGNFYVTGTTFNLGAATPTNITTSNVSFANPVFTNVTVTNALTAGSYTGAAPFTGNASFSGSGLTTFTIANSPTGATESGNTVTITTTAPCPFTAGQVVNVTKVGVIQYNGTWTVLAGCGSGSSFTYTDQANASMANSGGGSVTLAPLVATGGPAGYANLNAGLFDNLDYYLYNLTEIGGGNYRTTYQNISGHKDMTANGNIIRIPASSTQDQADAVVGIVQNFAGTATSGTGVLSIAECDSTNCRNFGLGAVVNDNNFLTSTNVGQENDVGWSQASTSIGLNLVSFGNVTPNASSAALFIQNNTPGTPANGWGTGIKLGTGTSVAPSATQAGLLFGPLNTGVTQASQGIAMNSTSAGGATLTTTWSEDSAGSNQFNSTNAHVFSVSGTPRAQVTASGLFGVGTIGPVTDNGTFLGGGSLHFAGIFLTRCTSSASPAVCSGASTGFVNIAAAATTIVVNTTEVSASSTIHVTFDESLGTALSVTCNTAAASEGATYFVSARSAGTSFTIKTNTAPTTNPACLSFTIIN